MVTQEGCNPIFKAVLFYNQASCFHRLGMIKECIEAMKEALITLEDEVLMDFSESKDDISQLGMLDENFHIILTQEAGGSIYNSFQIIDKLNL